MSIDARGRDGSLVAKATLDGKAGAEELEVLSGALDHARFLPGLVDRYAPKVRAPQGARDAGATPPAGRRPGAMNSLPTRPAIYWPGRTGRFASPRCVVSRRP